MSAKIKPPTGKSRRSSAANIAKWFDGVIGQTAAKKQLGLYLTNHLGNGANMQNILFEGSFGDGKTYLVRKLCRWLPDPSNPKARHKELMVLDGSALESLDIFFQDICSTFADGQKYITVFIDEFHGVHPKIQEAMLQITERTDSGITTYEYDGQTYSFDASKVTWILATTESNKIRPALRSRFRGVQIQPYTKEELGQILEARIAAKGGNVKFNKGVLEALTGYIRANARSAAYMGDDILDLGLRTFGMDDMAYLIEQLNVHPHGLNTDEIRLMKMLAEGKELSLGTLASRFRKPSVVVQKEIEPYPIALGFVEIKGLRSLTPAGRFFLKGR